MSLEKIERFIGMYEGEHCGRPLPLADREFLRGQLKIALSYEGDIDEEDMEAIVMGDGEGEVPPSLREKYPLLDVIANWGLAYTSDDVKALIAKIIKERYST